ncbi:CoA ester lyase [Cytobacillus kochii]|uniref:HpcH/HpaI aldolase/citrate lyase family protein n=1 Tax=Cytobacillus TaxID=2675230 RepID=UPI002E1FA67E|nr:CoA ester lyase [Cytobacillus kochii]
MDTTFLFVPGNNEKKLGKIDKYPIDVIIIDLEDAVVVEEKKEARALVYNFLKERNNTTKNLKIYIRINALTTQWFFDDINMINKLKHIDGIMIPKCENQTPIDLSTELLNSDLEILPLIETANGVNNTNLILNHPAVTRVAFGSVDFALDIGVNWSEEGIERLYAMNKIVLDSKLQGALPPIDAVFPLINNKENFLKDAHKGKQIGFTGKLLIHPQQIEWVNDVYKPTDDQLDWCNRVIALYENTQNKGATHIDGKLIDRPIYLLAKRLISMG